MPIESRSGKHGASEALAGERGAVLSPSRPGAGRSPPAREKEFGRGCFSPAESQESLSKAKRDAPSAPDRFCFLGGAEKLTFPPRSVSNLPRCPAVPSRARREGGVRHAAGGNIRLAVFFFIWRFIYFSMFVGDLAGFFFSASELIYKINAASVSFETSPRKA